MVAPKDYGTIGIITKGTLSKKQAEQQFSMDMGAYKRIRKQGLQPRTIDGSAELEKRANNRLEVEMGQLFSKEDWPKALEGMARAEEIKEAIKLERIHGDEQGVRGEEAV